jgi:hypothetical protein
MSRLKKSRAKKLIGEPYKTVNHILAKPRTPKKLITKKNKKPKSPKLKTKLFNNSHSIINFIKIGKPLYTNKDIQTNNAINGTITDIPLKFNRFLEVVCF